MLLQLEQGEALLELYEKLSAEERMACMQEEVKDYERLYQMVDQFKKLLNTL